MDKIGETIDLLTRKFKRTLSDAKYRAKQKGLAFALTFTDLRDRFIKQQARCFYTGLPFNFKDTLATLSIDRIDNDQGYVLDNIVWCRSGVNSLKSSRSYAELKDICLTVAFHNVKWNLIGK